MNFTRKVFEIREIVQDQMDATITMSEAEDRLYDLLTHVFFAGAAAAVSNDIRDKVREQLANDPHCYD